MHKFDSYICNIIYLFSTKRLIIEIKNFVIFPHLPKTITIHLLLICKSCLFSTVFSTIRNLGRKTHQKLMRICYLLIYYLARSCSCSSETKYAQETQGLTLIEMYSILLAEWVSIGKESLAIGMGLCLFKSAKVEIYHQW